MEEIRHRQLQRRPAFPLIAFWSVVLIGFFPGQSLAQSVSPGTWQIYTSPDYGFSVQYPDDMTFHSGRPDYKEISLLSYIPVCDETTVACFAYNGSELKGTNFQAAALSVNVLREARTEKECQKIDTGSFPVRHTQINGTRFTYGTTGGVGLGNTEGGTTYRTFRQNVCFEVALGVAASSMGNFDPGTIKQFDGRRLDKEMNRMVHTFNFVGSVKDGPAWSVYHNNMVGGTFEYPDNASVHKIIEYSNERFYSSEVSDVVSFADHGLHYTVTTKVNLKYSEMDSWLKLAGYPPLTDTKLAKRSTYYTEYEAGFYHYIVGQGILYILGVSDDKQHPMDPKTAPVFQHFLNSFKAN